MRSFSLAPAKTTSTTRKKTKIKRKTDKEGARAHWLPSEQQPRLLQNHECACAVDVVQARCRVQDGANESLNKSGTILPGANTI